MPPRISASPYRWLPTRQSLLSRLRRSGDDESWKVFFDTYSLLIYNAVRRAGLSDSEAQDVVQETVISVCRCMPNFKYDPEKGSFKNWLLRVTQRRVADYLRKRGRDRRFGINILEGEEGLDALLETPDPTVRSLGDVWEAEWEQNLWEAALNRLKERVDLFHYQIFDAYVLQAWKISDVTRILGVSVSRVYVVKHRLSKLLKKEYVALRDQSDSVGTKHQRRLYV